MHFHTPPIIILKGKMCRHQNVQEQREQIKECDACLQDEILRLMKEGCPAIHTESLYTNSSKWTGEDQYSMILFLCGKTAVVTEAPSRTVVVRVRNAE